MGLDFNYTCSGIDANIRDFKSIMHDHVLNIISEASPLMEGAAFNHIVKDYVDSIYNDCEDIFEDLRKCNEDMRQQADKQIDELIDKVDDLESDLYTANERIRELETDLSLSEDRCEELEQRIAF